MKTFLERASVIQQRVNELYAKSAAGDLYGSKVFIEKTEMIALWMKQAGLETRIDNIGNIRGKLKTKTGSGKTFVIGSHFDTSAGEDKYDGILGILTGIDVAEHLQDQQFELPFNIEFIAFAEEEGLRFNHNYLGSKVVAGTFQNKLLELKDKDGVLLSQVLQSLHYSPEKIMEDAISTEDLLGYFEIHIEQGCILADANIPFGIASSIYGQKRIEIKFTGKHGHAGSTPMENRHDSLAAAAKFILSVEKYAKGEKNKNLVATIGKLNVHDPASNKIPETVTCTLDLRSNEAELLSEAYESINFTCEKICDKRNIYFEWKLVQETDPVICNKKLRKLLATSIAEKNIPFISLESGAIYDAAIIAKVAPVCLLLLKSFRNDNGNSYENEEKNIALSLEITDHFIKQLIASSERSFKKKEK